MPYTEEDLKPIPQSDKVGIPLLREILERIKEDQRAWNQGNWIGRPSNVEDVRPNLREQLDHAVVDYIKEHHVPPWNCGTAYCVAGHVVLAKGAKLMDYDVERAEYFGQLRTSMIVTPDGYPAGVSAYAAELIGLTEEQADELFYGGNTLARIEQLVETLEED